MKSDNNMGKNNRTFIFLLLAYIRRQLQSLDMRRQNVAPSCQWIQYVPRPCQRRHQQYTTVCKVLFCQCEPQQSATVQVAIHQPHT